MAYPTETSYALGGNAWDEEVVEKVYRLKGRDAEKALLVLIDRETHLAASARNIHPAALRLMDTHWPGPLTLVLHAATQLPSHLKDRRGTVALRESPHPVVGELLRIGGVPLIGTSANKSGALPAHSAEEVRRSFAEAVGLIVDGSKTPGGPPSTVVDTTVLPFRVLREGAVSSETLSQTLHENFSMAVPA